MNQKSCTVACQELITSSYLEVDTVSRTGFCLSAGQACLSLWSVVKAVKESLLVACYAHQTGQHSKAGVSKQSDLISVASRRVIEILLKQKHFGNPLKIRIPYSSLRYLLSRRQKSDILPGGNLTYKR